MTLVDHHFAQSLCGLAIGERGAKHIGRTQSAGGGVHACIGNDAQHASFASHFVYAHLHTRMNRANQYIYFVALHQFAGVFNPFRWFRLVIHFKELNFATTDFAAGFLQSHAKPVIDGHTQLCEGAGIGQHQAYAQFGVLGMRGQ